MRGEVRKASVADACFLQGHKYVTRCGCGGKIALHGPCVVYWFGQCVTNRNHGLATGTYFLTHTLASALTMRLR